MSQSEQPMWHNCFFVNLLSLSSENFINLFHVLKSLPFVPFYSWEYYDVWGSQFGWTRREKWGAWGIAVHQLRCKKRRALKTICERTLCVRISIGSNIQNATLLALFCTSVAVFFSRNFKQSRFSLRTDIWRSDITISQTAIKETMKKMRHIDCSGDMFLHTDSWYSVQIYS